MMNFKILFGNLCLLITFFNVGNSCHLHPAHAHMGAQVLAHSPHVHPWVQNHAQTYLNDVQNYHNIQHARHALHHGTQVNRLINQANNGGNGHLSTGGKVGLGVTGTCGGITAGICGGGGGGGNHNCDCCESFKSFESCSGLSECIGNCCTTGCHGIENCISSGCEGISKCSDACNNCLSGDCLICLGPSGNGHGHHGLSNCCSSGHNHGHHDSCCNGGNNGNFPNHHHMGGGDWFFFMDPTMFWWNDPLWTSTSRNVYGYDIPEDDRVKAKKDLDQAMSLYIFKEKQTNNPRQSAQIWADVRDQYNTEEKLYGHFNGQDDNGQDRLQGFRQFVANNASARPASFGLRTSDSIDCLQNVNQRILDNQN